MSRRRVLLVTHDVIGERMAGPAIRCWELAAQLARSCDVQLTSRLPTSATHPDFVVTTFEADERRLVAQAGAADILVVQGLMLELHPVLESLGKYLVVDLYDPFVFENYPDFKNVAPDPEDGYQRLTAILNRQLRVGDFFMCASERQRDLWLGALAAHGRLGPEQYLADPALRHLIDLVPFGIPDYPPRAGGPVLRGVVPGIHEDDFVLLWGGGIYDWFDPLSVIRAVANLAREGAPVKLFFLGVAHPNPDVLEMDMAEKAAALAEELGVSGTHVFFNREWVPYPDRQSYLLEASAGICAHFDNIETRFAFRTRMLDYLWAGLPLITTEGDDFARLTREHDLGEVVAYGDVEGWQRAIVRLAADPARCAAARDRVRESAWALRWSQVVHPLAAYCAAPRRPERPFDRLHVRHLPDRGTINRATIRERLGMAHALYRKGVRILREEGSAVFIRKGLAYLAYLRRTST